MNSESLDTNPVELFAEAEIPHQTDHHLTTFGVDLEVAPDEEVTIETGDIIGTQHKEGHFLWEFIVERKPDGFVTYSLSGKSYMQVSSETISESLQECLQYKIFKDPYNRRKEAEYREKVHDHKTIERNEKTWSLTQYDTGCYQWIRELDDNEYDWDPEEDDISIIGFDTPCRTVNIRFENGTFTITGNETAGPNYHRPGYTELISSEFSETADNTNEAMKRVLNMIERLS